MKSFPLGGRKVHRVGFGAMQLPGRGAFGPPRDRAEALAVVRRAVELGVDHIDTAQYYGPDVANELLRSALYPYPERLVIVSKVGAERDARGGWVPAQRPEQLRAGVIENLKALKLERLAVVNLRLTGQGEFGEQLDAMIAMRDEGLIGGIGLSNVEVGQLREALGRTEIACVQNPFNLVDRGSEEVLRECAERGIAFVPFFPLGAAFGRERVLGHPRVKDVARRLDVTPAQVALAWVLAVAPNTLLIPGTSRLEHLEENLAVAHLRLDEGSLAELGVVGAIGPSATKHGAAEAEPATKPGRDGAR
ncbi:oxidoreductase [Dactylosporangium sucinum]|uniref:oxidoreductase n=1 Tax=Dactylosporangium sucinum TaxID=1424081 RepID=UPI00167E54F7|nr:oxidoreductase [Dactylosporangium sucinum]